MTDRDALLAAILAAPDDDAPRLIYADWCDEAGEDGQAAMIRWQCASPTNVYKLNVGNDLLFWPPDGRTVGKLQCPPWCLQADAARGFLCGVMCAAADWLQHADALLAAHPVTAVTLTTGLLPRGDGERTGIWYDPAERWFTSDDLNAAFRLGDDLITNLLRCRWPRVREWALPPAVTIARPRRRMYLRLNGGPRVAITRQSVTVDDAGREVFEVATVDGRVHRLRADRPGVSWEIESEPDADVFHLTGYEFAR